MKKKAGWILLPLGFMLPVLVAVAIGVAKYGDTVKNLVELALKAVVIP